MEFDITWQACSNYRINQIFNECQNISDILTKWPQYLRPEGYKLVSDGEKRVKKSKKREGELHQKLSSIPVGANDMLDIRRTFQDCPGGMDKN